MIRAIKNLYQRLKRGYTDEDVWSFDAYLNKIIPSAVRQIAKGPNGCPGTFWDKKNKNDECYKWKVVLEEIAQGFEAAESISNFKYINLVKKEEGYIQEVDKKKLKMLTKKYDRGMDLFKKYYMALWD